MAEYFRSKEYEGQSKEKNEEKETAEILQSESQIRYDIDLIVSPIRSTLEASFKHFVFGTMMLNGGGYGGDMVADVVADNAVGRVVLHHHSPPDPAPYRHTVPHGGGCGVV